jgi:hypothetical protein
LQAARSLQTIFFRSFVYFFCHAYGDSAGDQPYNDGSFTAVKAVPSFLANPTACLAAFIDSLEPSIAQGSLNILFHHRVYITPYCISEYT